MRKESFDKEYIFHKEKKRRKTKRKKFSLDKRKFESKLTLFILLSIFNKVGKSK
jgi:hypothetical protein